MFNVRGRNLSVAETGPFLTIHSTFADKLKNPSDNDPSISIHSAFADEAKDPSDDDPVIQRIFEITRVHDQIFLHLQTNYQARISKAKATSTKNARQLFTPPKNTTPTAFVTPTRREFSRHPFIQAPSLVRLCSWHVRAPAPPDPPTVIVTDPFVKARTPEQLRALLVSPPMRQVILSKSPAPPMMSRQEFFRASPFYDQPGTRPSDRTNNSSLRPQQKPKHKTFSSLEALAPTMSEDSVDALHVYFSRFKTWEKRLQTYPESDYVCCTYFSLSFLEGLHPNPHFALYSKEQELILFKKTHTIETCSHSPNGIYKRLRSEQLFVRLCTMGGMNMLPPGYR